MLDQVIGEMFSKNKNIYVRRLNLLQRFFVGIDHLEHSKNLETQLQENKYLMQYYFIFIYFLI